MTGARDEEERIWPTTANQDEYRRKYPDHFGRYEFALGHVTGKCVLDCASGAGYGTWLLARGGAQKVIGVDVDPEAVAWAGEHFKIGNNEFRLGDGKRLPLADGEVDQVVSLETLEHVTDAALFLRELARVLRPGGGLVLSTPHTPGPERFKPSNKYHLREYDAAELEALVAPHFEIAERFGQQSRSAARFGAMKRAPLIGSLVSRGVHRVLPGPVRALARAWLSRPAATEIAEGKITKPGWQDSPVQLLVARKRG